MTGGVDEECGVPKQCRADEKTPDKSRPAGHQKTTQRQQDRRREEVPVEPAQFRVFREIRDHRMVRMVILTAQDPAEMRPPKPVALHGMNIVGQVRILMMNAMVPRPPERTLLRCRTAEPSQRELHRAACPVRTVRKVA